MSESVLNEVIRKYEGLEAENKNLVKEIELLSIENVKLEDKKRQINEENKRLLKVLIKYIRF